MALQAYRKKRNFKITPEPPPKVAKRRTKQLRYVIQKHDATRLHYDFRLELDGVLKSWAVPKGPSFDPDKRALAVEVEDHPLDYGEFEGIIPQGQYGGGTVLLWDRGTWEPQGDARAGLRAGKLHFKLAGEKLSGEWALIRLPDRDHSGKHNWLLMKIRDEFADKKLDITAKRAESVKTGRSLEEIADDKNAVWNSNRGNGNDAPAPKLKRLKASQEKSAAKPRRLVRGTSHVEPSHKTHAKAVELPTIEPQLATFVEHPPAGDDWLHEVKFDGYRLTAYVNAGKVKLVTRGQQDWTAKFQPIADELEHLAVDNAILDGEVVVLDGQGRSHFQSLQNALRLKQSSSLIYYAFDMPWCNAVDLRRSRLIDRKELLETVLKTTSEPKHVLFSDHVAGKGDAMIDQACKMSLEGIVSKRADAHYVSARSKTWLKSKCGHRQEFVIIGYTAPRGIRVGLGAILLGYHDAGGNLCYAGRVGTGFNVETLQDLIKQLKAMHRPSPPTADPPPSRERKNAHWVAPRLVAEIKFTGWTGDNMIRHGSFMGLRSDKAASAIVREDRVPANSHTHRKSKSHAASNHAANEIEDTNSSRSAKSRSAQIGKRKAGLDARSGGETGVANEIKLTNPDRVLFPETKLTKSQLADYYRAVAEPMLPHVIDRPLSLLRCPEGRGKECFFQRHFTPAMPKSLEGIDVSENGKPKMHVMIRDVSGLVGLVQIGTLEIHAWGSRASNVDKPDRLVFDLDPDPSVGFKETVAAARAMKSFLEKLKLPVFLKTTGGKGLHLVVPIEPTVDWEQAKPFAKLLADEFAARDPGRFLTNMRKALRTGKIYIDYLRNGRGASAIAPYSIRAREGAPVSTPIEFEELGRLKSGAAFDIKSVIKRVAKGIDPWKDFDDARIDLLKVIGKV